MAIEPVAFAAFACEGKKPGWRSRLCKIQAKNEAFFFVMAEV